MQEAAAEMMDYKGSGMSVMEMSHRSKWFDDIIKDAEKDLRELMNIRQLQGAFPSVVLHSSSLRYR